MSASAIEARYRISLILIGCGNGDAFYTCHFDLVHNLHDYASICFSVGLDNNCAIRTFCTKTFNIRANRVHFDAAFINPNITRRTNCDHDVTFLNGLR